MYRVRPEGYPRHNYIFTHQAGGCGSPDLTTFKIQVISVFIKYPTIDGWFAVRDFDSGKLHGEFHVCNSTGQFQYCQNLVRDYRDLEPYFARIEATMKNAPRMKLRSHRSYENQ